MSERQIIVNAGSVILDNDKVLLVQEKDAPFTGRWNFPLGKLEDETLPQAAVREAKEETGYDTEILGCIGVYQSLSAPGVNVVITMFVSKVVSGELNFDPNELMNAKWFNQEELSQLQDSELFHPEMRKVIQRAINKDYSVDRYIQF